MGALKELLVKAKSAESNYPFGHPRTQAPGLPIERRKTMHRGFISVGVALTLGLLLGAGAAAGGYFIGYGFYQGRRGERYVTVKGLVERNVKADLAVWKLNFSATGADIATVSAESDSESKLVRAFITKAGFTDKEVSALPTKVIDRFANPFAPSNVSPGQRYVITGGYEIRTSRVDLVQHVSQTTGDLIREGVVLGGNEFQGGANPAYMFTDLNAIRPAMLAQATKSARAVAAQFAADSHSRLGTIRRASQGVFQLMSRDGETTNPTEQRESIDKKVRLVSTVEFYLVD